jgi:hypothetical protein
MGVGCYVTTKIKKFIVVSGFLTCSQARTDQRRNVKAVWDVMLCHWVSRCRRFEKMYCLHLEGSRRLRKLL